MTEEPTVSALALLVLTHGGWPLSEAEAAAVVLRYFVGASGSPTSKRKLIAKFGFDGDKLSVDACQRAAEEHARAVLAELLLVGLAEARTVGPGRAVGLAQRDDISLGPVEVPRAPKRLTYSRTTLGRKVMERSRTSVTAALARAGWP